MNDKQKGLALEMAVQACRWLTTVAPHETDDARKRCKELMSDYMLAADPKPRPLTVEDIQKPQPGFGVNVDYWYIRCGDYDWTSDGWFRQPEGSSGYPKHVADVLYAGLVATKTLPPQEDA